MPTRPLRFRPVLDAYAPYRPTEASSAPDGRSYMLSQNESPFAPLPSVLKVIADSARNIHRYPDSNATELTRAIASHYDVPLSHVAVGCGSVGVIQQLLAALVEPGGEVIYAWRSFEAFPYLSDLAGATSLKIPLRSEKHDLEAMARAITPRTKLIFLCTPNNPTGTVVPPAELERFLGHVPQDCLVVLDEAYAEYARGSDIPDGLELHRGRPNLAVLRTFSKAYGLAGLRVGFLVGHEPVVTAVRTTMLTFSVNALAQAAAIASLAAETELLARVATVTRDRERIRDELLAEGWTVPPSAANFVWLRLGDDTTDFASACGRAGVSIRAFAGEGARVTVGDHEANDAFLAIARAYPRRH